MSIDVDGVVLPGVDPHTLVVVHPQQQLWGFTSGAGRAADGCAELCRIIEKAVVALGHGREWKSHRFARPGGNRLLDAQMADGRDRPACEQRKVLFGARELAEAEKIHPPASCRAGRPNVVEQGGPVIAAERLGHRHRKPATDGRMADPPGPRRHHPVHGVVEVVGDQTTACGSGLWRDDVDEGDIAPALLRAQLNGEALQVH